MPPKACRRYRTRFFAEWDWSFNEKGDQRRGKPLGGSNLSSQKTQLDMDQDTKHEIAVLTLSTLVAQF
jgi:hypothetical protein